MTTLITADNIVASGVERPIREFGDEAVFIVKLPFDIEWFTETFLVLTDSFFGPIGVFLAASDDSDHELIITDYAYCKKYPPLHKLNFLTHQIKHF